MSVVSGFVVKGSRHVPAPTHQKEHAGALDRVHVPRRRRGVSGSLEAPAARVDRAMDRAGPVLIELPIRRGAK